MERSWAKPKEINIPPKPDSTYIVDQMAAIRSFSSIPETYEYLFNRLSLSATFPKKYKWVGIVVDTFKPVSIKDGERDKQGSSDMIMVKSSKIRIASNFNNFLKNSENKIRVSTLKIIAKRLATQWSVLLFTFIRKILLTRWKRIRHGR